MTAQTELFATTGGREGTSAINARCVINTADGHRVVLVAGIPIAQYAVEDRMAEAHAMVLLVEQGWAEQGDVARAFGASSRTVRRHQWRFEEGGLVALGRRAGFPAGKSRVTGARVRLVTRLKADGCSNREIARRVGVSEKAIRKLLRRQGWRELAAEQLPLPADPKVSAPAVPPVEKLAGSPAPPADPNVSAPAVLSVEKLAGPLAPPADPKVSAPAVLPVEKAGLLVSPADPNVPAPAVPSVEKLAGLLAPPADPNLFTPSLDEVPVSFDVDPADRRVDRILACLGMLDDAAPMFRDGQRVPRAGVLLAIPALLKTGCSTKLAPSTARSGPRFTACGRPSLRSL